jgi:hypothetical protein
LLGLLVHFAPPVLPFGSFATPGFSAFAAGRVGQFSMRYFTHIVTDRERIVDTDGAEFPSLEAARREAIQSARDLMAGELMAGRTVPLGWRLQIADTHETIVVTIPFATLVSADGDPYTPRAGAQVAGVREPDARELAKATILHSQQSRAEIREGLDQLWAQLRTLGKMNARLGRELAPADP